MFVWETFVAIPCYDTIITGCIHVFVYKLALKEFPINHSHNVFFYYQQVYLKYATFLNMLQHTLHITYISEFTTCRYTYIIPLNNSHRCTYSLLKQEPISTVWTEVILLKQLQYNPKLRRITVIIHKTFGFKLVKVSNITKIKPKTNKSLAAMVTMSSLTQCWGKHHMSNMLMGPLNFQSCIESQCILSKYWYH